MGKPFKHPVTTTFLDDAGFDAVDFGAFGTTWSADGAKSYLGCAPDRYSREIGPCDAIRPVSSPSLSAMFLRFVGVAYPVAFSAEDSAEVFNPQRPAGSGPREGSIDPRSADISGLYDSAADVLYLRGTNLVEVQRTVARELVHAWQDQHGLLTMESAGPDVDSVTLGLIEGHAELISMRYMSSRPEPERRAVRLADGRSSASWLKNEIEASRLRTPRQQEARNAQRQIDEWPYVAGSAFLVGKDPKTLVKLLRSGPRSTWSLMHPTLSDRGRGVAVDLPRPNGPLYSLDGFSVGPLYWSVGLRATGADAADVDAFVDLWIGDRAVVYYDPFQSRQPNGVCMLDRIRFADDRAARTGELLLRQWQAGQPTRPR